MQAYTELVPPTAVTHSLVLPFLQPQSQDLIVVKTSLLQIFQLRNATDNTSPEFFAASSTAPSDSTNTETSIGSRGRKKLWLLGEYQLAGTVTSLARIKAQNTKTGGEALLISFRDAKASLIEWNQETYNLSTISIHLYETEDLIGSPWAPELSQCSSYLTVDPSSRCAGLKFGVRNLAIIPFRQVVDDLTMGDYDPALDDALPTNGPTEAISGLSDAKMTPYGPSFVLLLTELDPNIVFLSDLAFLYEYREPTLGVLSAAKSPSLGLAQLRKDTLNYTVFTLDLEQRASTSLISVPSLPSDIFKIVPLPVPVGGALLIGGNELVHVDQSGKTHAVGVNEFAKQASNFAMTDQSQLGLRLEGCSASHPGSGSSEVLLVLRDGNFVVVKFKLDGRTVSGFTVKPVASERGGSLLQAPASCISRLTGDLIFVGSEDGDSLLLGSQRRRTPLTRKRSRADEGIMEDEGATEDDLEEEDDLYGGDAVTPKSATTPSIDEVTYSIVDRLPNLTSVGQPVLGKRKWQSADAQSSSNSASEQLEIAVATGCGKSSHVTFLKRKIGFERIDALPLERAERLWTLSSTSPQTQKSVNGSPSRATSLSATTFVVTSQSNDGGSSAIYEVTPGGIKRKVDSDFESDVTTTNAGFLFDGKRIVQVSPGETRCYPLGKS